MTWTLVQHTGSDLLSGSTPSLAFPSNVAAGNVIIGNIFYTDSNTTDQISTITSTLGDTVNFGGFVTANPTQVYNMAWFWTPTPLAAGGADTINFNLNVSPGSIWVEMAEFTPPAGTASIAIDVSGGQYNASGSPVSGSITPNNNGDLLLCANACNGSVTGVGTGWTVTNTENASSGSNQTFGARSSLEHLNQSTAAAQNGTWAGTPAGDDICTIVAFKSIAAAVNETETYYPALRKFGQPWNINKQLFQTITQDSSSFGVETNPHWRGRIYPLQWNINRSWFQDSALDVLPLDVPTYTTPRQFPLQWNISTSLYRTITEDSSSFGVETNPHWRSTSWPLVWTLMPLTRAIPTDVPFISVETNVNFRPRMWPLQWSTQASLMRLTAQDFSSVAPVVQAVYARYGAAHGVGMLSAIPGEVPS